MIGTQLGPYEITAKVGEGGMGEVYRATDSKLRREVAIKVLPDTFAADAERLARFEREAQLLAQLHHPHIASIFGLEDSGEKRALIMELVEGPTLDERMASGALSVEDVLPIARQIAEALEEAHEKGIVHRDLKPQNIKLTPDGQVKVLDFGLAKAMDPQGEVGVLQTASRLAASPTLTLGATVQGVILGTAGYMAPEQAKGAAVDKRADIWAFGVLLLEMLTGRRVFAGETMSETLASVLKDPVDFDALPATTPAFLVRLLRRCLERDPKRRLRDIGEARIVLDAPPVETSEVPAPAGSKSMLWLLPATAAVAAVLGVVGATLLRSPEAARPQARFASLALPEGTRLALSGIQPGPPAVSPDGQRIAYVGEEETGRRTLWVQDLGERNPRRLEGTEDASYPFWSPDGRHLGFIASQKLQRIPVQGGSPIPLADAVSGKGGSWSREGVILFAPAFNSPLYRVSENGGDAEPLTQLDVEAGESSHRFPRFLPDDRRFLFVARGRRNEENRIILGSLDHGRLRQIVASPTNPLLASDQLLFSRGQTLVAQPFDTERGELRGSPVPLIENVQSIAGAARVVADAGAGTLLYRSGSDDGMRLVWLNRAGEEIDEVARIEATLSSASLSRSREKIAVEVANASTGTSDIWIFDAESGNGERFTYEETNEFSPVFAPDGLSIAYSSNASGAFQIMVKEVGGDGSNRVVLESQDPDEYLAPRSWTPNGELICYGSVETQGGSTTVFAVAADGTSPPRPLVETTFRDPVAQVSPDGRWLLYGDVTEDGMPSLLVTELPTAKRRWRITRGNWGWWSHDGSELFLQDLLSGLGVVAVRSRAEAFEWGPLEKILGAASRKQLRGGDGNRFLAIEFLAELDDFSRRLELILDWESLLDDRREEGSIR